MKKMILDLDTGVDDALASAQSTATREMTRAGYIK